MNEAWGIFVAVAIAHALGVASPGPDFAMVVRQTLAHGRRAGVLTALGIGSGILFHVAWAMFGLRWMVERIPALLAVLRYGGAAFLFWMGLEAVRARSVTTEAAQRSGERPADRRRAYLVGLATNLLNPKAVLFFVALCSTVVTASASTTLRLALGLWMGLATAAWFSFVALTVGHAAVRGRLAAYGWRIDQAMGVILIGIAVALVLTEPALA